MVALATTTNDATDLHFKTRTVRSNKAWNWMAGVSDAIYSLAMSTTVLWPLETIMYHFFAWQRDEDWHSNDLSKLPLVIMTNMSVSPAAQAMEALCSLMTTEADINSDSELHYISNFLHRGSTGSNIPLF